MKLVSAALALAVGVASISVAEHSGRATTYTGSWTPGAALAAAAGAMLLVGVAASARRPAFQLVVALWFAPSFGGWEGGPSLVRSAAPIAGALFFPVLLHLVLGGSRSSRTARALVATAYAEAIVVAVLLAVLREPYLDRECWANCSVNSFLVTSKPGMVGTVETVDRWCVALLAAAAAILLAVRLGRGSAVARRRLAPVAAPTIVLMAALVAREAALERSPVENPFNGVLRAIFAATASAVTLVGAGLLVGAFRRRRARQAVARIVATVGERGGPGRLQDELAAALADPDLQIVYPLSGGRGYVDGAGRSVPAPVPAAGRTLTRVKRGDRAVAIVSHQEHSVALDEHLDPATLLGVENESLRGQVLARLDELRASRVRIVEAADSERRRLERDLHDGAQQHLLALSYDVRRALSVAGTDRDAEAESVLTRVLEQTQKALAELRELAQGIYPAILAEAGLGPALESLSDTAPIPLEVRGECAVRESAAVEAAAYFAAVEALESAREREATHAVIGIEHAGGVLSIAVDDDGAAIATPPVALSDRVGAVGGAVIVEAGGLRMEIPCG